MNILIVAQIVDRDDAILGFFHGWLVEFSKHFSHVDVICLKEGAHALPDNVQVHSLGKESGKSRLKYMYRLYVYFWKWYVRKDVDYVFFHMGDIFNIVAAPFFFMRVFKKTKFVWWKAYGHISVIGKIALLFCDEVVTSTASSFPIETKKRRIVGQAVSTELFRFPDGGKACGKKVLYVGRITRIKHLDTFVGVAKVLEQEEYTFTVVGPKDDAAYYDEIVALASGTEISFVGPKTQNELVSLYQGSDIFLNTSLTHSLDKVGLEAVLCGCLPVTGNNGFRDLLTDTGLFVSSASVEGYIAAIRLLNAENMPQYRDMVAGKVKEHHSLNTFSDRVFDKLIV